MPEIMNKGELVAVYLLFACSVLPSALSSHFLGGSIMVRPKRGVVQSEMEITSHISWKRSSSGHFCDSSTLANSNITISTETFSCEYSCQGSVAIASFCIEYSADDDWTYLEGHETYIFNVSDINAVTIGTVSNAWVSPFGRWNISTTFSLVTRTDTGEINSTPRVVSFPYLNLLEGHNYNISLLIIDPDNDKIRCRWALDRECSSVCNGIPGAVLDPDSCTITYSTNFETGVKAVAIMIEDFGPCSFLSLSSVAHQFAVNVVSTSGLSCPSPPWFVSSLHGTCINIPPRTQFTYQLVATSGCSNIAITSIQIIAPIGTTENGPWHSYGTYNYYTNVAWTPTASQQNDTHFLCFMAINSENSASEQSCIKLAAGYHPPTPLIESATPNHQLVYPSNFTLQIMFDGRIQRPLSSAFIKFYKSWELVYQINASSSLEVTFNGPNLTIVPNYVFTEGNIFYINFDRGIVESVKGCHLGNDPIYSQTFWTFEVINLMPDVTAVNNQTEGQPLILQCSVTTIRDINSRVDFVWISNGIELRRVEGVVGVPTMNNLEMYTDHYIIPQLSDAGNNSLYICEVVINRSPVISATGNITLNIAGKMTDKDDVYTNSTFPSCSSLPQFDEPTLPQGASIGVPPGMLFIKQIMVIRGCSNIDVSSIETFTPNGTTVGELQHVQGTNRYHINIAWIPTADQLNSIHSFCFVAVNSAGLSSEPFCMHLAAGYHPPAPIPESATHQIHSSNHILQITFDRNIKRPSTSTFIRFYKPGEEVYQIDVSLSTEVTFVQSILTIKPNYTFTGGSTYYVKFDGGVVLSYENVEGYHLANEPILSESFWTFNVSTTGTKLMDTTTCDSGSDSNSVPFIISFAISAVVNLVLVAIITLACLFMKQKKILTIHRAENRQHVYTAEDDAVYELPELEPQDKNKQGSSSNYVNAPRRQKEKLPPTPKRHLKPDACPSDVKLEGNPSYRTPKYRNY